MRRISYSALAFQATCRNCGPQLGHLVGVVALCSFLCSCASLEAAETSLIRSVRDGRWSNSATWEAGSIPSAGDVVLVREGHHVVYDVEPAVVLRAVHISGVLEFSRDRDTTLEAGLIKVQAGEHVSEAGFGCEADLAATEGGRPRASLLVGTRAHPIPRDHTAMIRLHHVEGMDPESCPALVCCGGRMELHGAPMSRTWVKLKQSAHRGESMVLVPIDGIRDWKPGDRVIVTGTTRQFGYKRTRSTSLSEKPYTEERTIERIRIREPFDVAYIYFKNPLEYDHSALGEYRCEIANLSRNVIVESADPGGVRGHTMYHRHSAGAISYAEFRHLGKQDTLGRYSLHFHLARDTMRGASIVGASIWDSHNRWITIHNTSYLVVRDCVGYQSLGHGFFLEDGSETYNVLDRNLAVQALRAKKLPDQLLPFDNNLGSGFWWANSLNSFTRNVAAECDQDGFRFHVVPSTEFAPVLPILQRDGSVREEDIRALPFIRFDNNEAHCQRFFGLNLGGTSFGGVPPFEGDYAGKLDFEDVQGVGPDIEHPFVIRNFRCWNSLWPFHAGSPSVFVDGLDFFDSDYGIWRSVTDHHEYRNVRMDKIHFASFFYPRPGRPDHSQRLKFLSNVDDRPPVTMITESFQDDGGGLLVRGTTVDNGEVAQVLVNDRGARSIDGNFLEWEVRLPLDALGQQTLTAYAVDAAGNQEPTPHTLPVQTDLPLQTNLK